MNVSHDDALDTSSSHGGVWQHSNAHTTTAADEKEKAKSGVKTVKWVFRVGGVAVRALTRMLWLLVGSSGGVVVTIFLCVKVKLVASHDCSSSSPGAEELLSSRLDSLTSRFSYDKILKTG
jgi:hypothetical protein